MSKTTFEKLGIPYEERDGIFYPVLVAGTEKADKLTHQDIGQMQMYVNYYDRYEKLEDENPTIGILLCKEKNDALVEITLPQDANIYASEYKLYLPDKKLLQQKLKEWIEEEEE